MTRFKFVATAIAGIIVLGSISGSAVAKRRRTSKATATQDSTPATEVDADTSLPVAASPPAAQAPAEPAPDKKPPPTPTPIVERDPAPARPPVAAPVAATEVATARAAGDRPATRLSGHVGVASPLLTLRASRATRHVGSVNEDLTLVAPIGLGMELTEHWTFDFEFQISTGVRPEGLTTAIVDPGVVYAWDALAAGVRVGWQLNANQNIGLIPLARLAILRGERASWFVEASLPAFVRNKQVTASASLQTGVAF